jgi:hypothetical protein
MIRRPSAMAVALAVAFPAAALVGSFQAAFARLSVTAANPVQMPGVSALRTDPAGF